MTHTVISLNIVAYFKLLTIPTQHNATVNFIVTGQARLTLIGDFKSSTENIVCMSTSDCRTSRYTEPRKLSGTDNWNSSPLTMTKSPTVMPPTI